MLDAVIIAGGKEDKFPNSDNLNKALLNIKDRPMIEYVIDAVIKSAYIGRTVIVGPRAPIEENINLRIDKVIDDNEGMIDNINLGIEYLKPEDKVFVITSDIPLVSTEAVDDFIEQCLKIEADIYYPVISEKLNLKKYPQIERTYANLKEGSFTGGNMVLLNPEVASYCRNVLEHVVDSRKNLVKLSKMLGVKFMLRFFMGRLSLNEIEYRISEITGYKGTAIITDYPEIGLDVDKPSDLELVKNIL